MIVQVRKLGRFEAASDYFPLNVVQLSYRVG